MLQVRHLEKIIEKRSVLSIEQLDILPEQIVAVVGAMGSGKSLLIRVLAGMMTPSGGTVMINGEDIYRCPAQRERIGVLYEEDLLYERISAQKNLEFYRQLHNLPKTSVAEALALVGLSDQAEKPISKLSPSAQRRLAFARALMSRPLVLLLDQPILRTDPDTQALFLRLIAQAAQQGTAVLLTGEDLAWAGKCCTHVVEIDAGRVVSNRVREMGEQEPVGPERFIPYKVPARKDDRIILFDPADLLYATSRDGKTFLRTADEEASTNLTLQELETRLQGRGFFKAHRAYLVNLQYIKAVIQYTRNSYTLLLNDKQETMVPLSKQCEKELQELLGY